MVHITGHTLKLFVRNRQVFFTLKKLLDKNYSLNFKVLIDCAPKT